VASRRKVTDARQDEDGNISHVQLDGNRKFTSVDKAVEMAEQGRIANAHSVTKRDGSKYLRSNPNSKSNDNLDEMAGD
jgi:hypothetical protein